jgi:hypothetical protein
MRVIVVGMGVQGTKRKAVAGQDVVATVDPIYPEATYQNIEAAPLSDYDAALLCIPDEPKMAMLEYLLTHKKHLLVEKPLFANRTEDLVVLEELAKKNGVVCYTAYNHRFEPHFMRMKELIDSGRLGKIYSIRMFYGNGTARLVRNSAWRDQGAGVLSDLGSHLLDTINYWLGKQIEGFSIYSANRFENLAYDHVSFGSNADTVVQLEVSLLSWRNHFYADIYAENGTAHIQSLCKWGPSTFTFRDRKLPSGRPDEESFTLVQPDPTWEAEYEHFKRLCHSGENNIKNDIWINNTLQYLATSLA